eukprot:UN08827
MQHMFFFGCLKGECFFFSFICIFYNMYCIFSFFSSD